MFSAASVCQFGCLFVDTITSEWLNVKWRNLAVKYTVQNLARVRMSRSKVKVTGTKIEKVQHFVRESSSGARTSCGIPFGNGPREHGPPPVLRRWENQRMVSSYELGTYMTTGDLEQDLRSHSRDSRYSSLSMIYDCCNMTRSIFEILDERFSSAEMTFKCYSRSSTMSLLETPFLLTFYGNFLSILYLFWDSKKFVEDRILTHVYVWRHVHRKSVRISQ